MYSKCISNILRVTKEAYIIPGVVLHTPTNIWQYSCADWESGLYRPAARGGKLLPYMEGGGGGGVSSRLKKFYRPDIRFPNADSPLAQVAYN